MECEVVGAIESLDKAVGNTFETMVFNEIIDKHSLSFLPPWTDNAIGSLIEIRRPIDARLFLFVNEDHAKEMLNIISGCDNYESDQSQIYDIIRELSNEIVGRFATGLLKKGEEVEVGLPTIIDTKQLTNTWKPDKYQLIISYQIEENEVICCLEHDCDELIGLSKNKLQTTDNSEMQSELESTRIHNARLEKKLAKITNELIDLDRHTHFGFAAEGMVHNMNNSLMGVMGNAQMMQMQLQVLDLKKSKSKIKNAVVKDFGLLVSELLKRTDKILSNGQSLSQMLDTILKKSRIIQNLEFEPVDLNEIIKCEIDFLSTDLWFKHNVKLKVKLSVEPVYIYSVPSKISQMIYSFLQNSLDAMNDQDNPEISITTVRNGDFVQFSISDNGMGISEKILSRIFEPFFTTKSDMSLKSFSNKSRLGLGLSFCSDVVNEINGTIDVKTDKNKGTLVEVKLPYHALDN